MVKKADKCPVFTFLILLFLSSTLVSQAYKQPPYPRTDLDRCTIRCRETEEEISELFRCVAGCESKFGDQEWGETGSESTGSKEIDTKVEKCQQQCRQEVIEPRELQQCQERCDRTEAQQRNRVAEDPEREQELEKCLEMCQKQPGKQRMVCKKRCKRQYEEEKKGDANRLRSEEATAEEEQSDDNNPYHYNSQKFESRFETQDGSFQVLEDFSQRSPVLRGIENYRVAILKANPNTFLVPHHCDADSVFFVLEGKGIITLIEGEKRVSHSLEFGDVMMVSAGTTMYLINQEEEQILRMGLLIQPISTIPGKFWEFFTAGGENTESYYNIFSNGILETAFATHRDELERLFGESRQGVIVKIPQEKLKSLSKGALSRKKKEKDSKSPFNLLKRKPMYSNEFGSFHEASPDEYKQLQTLGISIGLAQMRQGVLMMPHYNSRTTYIIIVAEGSGKIEMGCPHLGRTQETSGQYKKVSSQLCKGDVIIVPASHPFALLSSPNESMTAVGFGINAQNNERNLLAGRHNILHQIESVAREIAFNVTDELVQKVLKNQKEPFFVQHCEKKQESNLWSQM